ncbi:MAG: protein translocase subunit SecDF [Dysgonomonas sp.]
MQNKGFVITFAILLTLVCCYYLSFSFITKSYDKKAEDYAAAYASVKANGNAELYDELYNKEYYSYLDSMSTEKVWMTFSWIPGFDKKNLGYTLKECREREIGLGLDLKGGMSVIVEVDVAEVLRSLGDDSNEAFNKALQEASDKNRKGSNRDYISIFVDEYKAIAGNDKLAPIFASKLKDQVLPTDKDAQVVTVLRKELNSVAENSFNVLRTRIDRFGVVAPNIQKLDNRAERIMIELPGIKEPERVRKLLQGSANLEFWKTYNLQEIQNYIGVINERSAAALANQNTTTANTDSLSTTTTVDSLSVNTQLRFTKPFSENFIAFGGGAIVGIVNKKDTAAVNDILYKYRDSYPSDLKFAWGFKANDQKESEFALYALRGDGIKKGPALDGDVVISAKADQAQRGSAWEVDMQMNSVGTQRWAAITGAEIGRSIAIVLDGHVYSAPNVNQKIDGGRSQITGNFTTEDAKDLENVLKSGKMKAGVHIVQEDIVGPSLGQEAINAGFFSFVLALVLLMAYICIVYGLIPGAIANSALIINLFFTIGILAAFGAVMTLPGITGLVLALALAVDANVLIYERTREELRAGKNVRTAVIDGYKHAFSAIFDGHASQVITAIILVYFGTGPIQGFATTLIIGIVASFITSVFLTRIFYEYMFDKGKFQNLTFSTAISKKLFVHSNINFLGLTKKVAIFSLVVLLGGGVSLLVNGLNGGIDFTGGRNYLVRFDKNVNTADIYKALEPQFEGANLIVLTSGSASQSSNTSQVRITTNYKVEQATDEVEAEIRTKMTTALQSYLQPGTTIDNYIQSSQRVGPSVADDLKTAATIAVVIAVICMAVYILIRFRDIAFSVGTLIAVAHDAVLVILLYSILYKIMPFSMEIDQSFIAAVLTVVGYSINDKVVIFDRIREIRTMYPKRNVTDTINEALNSTLGRTMNTSLSSMLVIFCIFLLGGDTIRSFTFAIFIGIMIGTYSSLFVATPIAWKILQKEQSKKNAELSSAPSNK